ncbi:MAG: class I SAM-dependent methyltransferase [Actinomycetales bacterium]
MDPAELPGTIASPNIWSSPDIYEVENQGVDPDRVIEGAMRSIHDWAGQRVLDIGCGTGFHLPRFAEDAARVYGVEPYPPLVERAAARLGRLDAETASRIELLTASAHELPLPQQSVDVAHARWAYFFGPGCEPGLAELDRVMRPAGTAFVIDNDPTRSTFGRWFSTALPDYDALAVQRFWARKGWTRTPLTIRWEFATRADFEAVVGIEFAPARAAQILASHPGSEVDYAVNLWHKRF